ncbi:shieldin complex subunit 2 isoform X4 [Scyliorhinus torazame]|uniref:shieldin complex subunit 2 isoform X4 n=1 Tax=Scyliorhinus torazame TaxID=75743 RepID=UPI003B5CE8D9
MSNEKIHVFLGAPAVLSQRKTSAKEAVADGSSKKWLQCQVWYENGSLNAKPRDCSTKESQEHFICHEAMSQLKNRSGLSSTSKREEGNIALSQECAFENLDASLLGQGMSKECDLLHNKEIYARQIGKQLWKGSSNRTLLNSEGSIKITEEHDSDPINPASSGGSSNTPLVSYSRSRQSRENRSDNRDPTDRIAEQNAPLREDCPEFLCDSLTEYLQHTFPAEGQQSCSRCTTVNEGLSTDAEFLSVLTASQASIHSQGLSQRQFITQDLHENLKGKLGKSTIDTKLPCLPLACTHIFIGPDGESTSEAVWGQGDSSENTQELFSLLSNRQSASEVVAGRTSESSEQPFSPITKWSEDDVEVNIEPYGRGILCSQVADSSKWSLEGSIEATEVQVTQTSRSSVYLDGDSPSCKKMKTMYSERRRSDLGRYLKAQGDRWPIPKIGLIDTEQLKNCTDRSRKYHILVTILSRCLLKEIQIKSGSFAGCRVPIATILVTDQSGVTMKIALWRASAFWALSVFPGDILVVTENTYTYRGKEQQKVVLSVEQIKGQPGTLTLWGNGMTWHTQIQKKLDHVWDFRNLLVFQNPITGDLELHTTPWSSCECLFDDDERAIAFRTKYHPSETAAIKVMDLYTLLHTKYSGSVQLRTHIVAMQWNAHSTLNPFFTMDASTPVETVFASLSHFTYSGCGNCGSELELDENGIYQQCIPCLPNGTVQIFYRPTMLVITDQGFQIDVLVSSKLMEKIFLNIPPTCLSKLLGPSDKVTYGMAIADLCCSLFADPSDCYVVTLQSQFHLDENSIAMKQEFYLLDFRSDH